MTDKQFNVCIVDDEEICIRNLSTSLGRFPMIALAGTACNTTDASELVFTIRPDLLFLDIEIPQKSGIDLLREWKDAITWNMQVVFYTAYDKYLLDALRVSAFDYLLKPYTEEEFQLIIHRFTNKAQKQREVDFFRSNVEKLIPSKTFMIATATGYQMLRVENSVIFQYHGSKKSWSVLLSDQKQLYLKRGTSAQDILNYSHSFIQINQQCIINFDYLSLINDHTCILFPPFDQMEFTISRKFLKALLDRFGTI